MILEAIVAMGGGGLFGALGSLASSYIDSKKAKTEARFELANRRLDLEESKLNNTHELLILDKEFKGRKMTAEVDLAIAENAYEREAILGSYKHDSKLKSYKWVDAIRSLMRPIITSCCLYFICFIGYTLLKDYGVTDFIESSIIANFIERTLDFSFFILSWWFGGRVTRKKL